MLSNQPNSQLKLSVGYIGGEYDGLMLTNLLNLHLKTLYGEEIHLRNAIKCHILKMFMLRNRQYIR